MKINDVLLELGIDPKTASKKLNVKSIGKRTIPLNHEKFEKQLMVTLQLESPSDVEAKALANTKYGISYYQDRTDKYVWFVDFLRVYADAPVSKVR